MSMIVLQGGSQNLLLTTKEFFSGPPCTSEKI